jgi:hypothetical protein
MATRPSWDVVKTELKNLRALVDDAAKTRNDADGPLSDVDVELAKKALDAIDAAVVMIGPCPQALSPYRR